MLIHLDDELCRRWGYDMDLTAQDLNLILTILEKAGMSPPGYSSHVVDAEGDVIYDWEPEDE